MRTPINDFLRENKQNGMIPFHMPGHKRRLFGLSEADFLDADITEITGADNLLKPEGIIRETHDAMARLFGAERTFMLVNGASAGILAAITACCGQGGGLILARNSHVSAYNAMAIAGVRHPIYVYPEMSTAGFATGIKAADIEVALARHGDIRAVFVISPTYEGICSDIGRIAETVHRYGKILIVDEAHGAHFAFHPDFPQTALEQGADIVIQSLHKTLPALTQSALLHVAHGAQVDQTILARCLAMVQTTSPSYLLMAGMERCAALLANQGDTFFQPYLETLKATRARFVHEQPIQLLEKQNFFDLDISKLVFLIHAEALTGSVLAERFRQKAQIELEMAGLRHVVALSSVADAPEWFDKLYNAVADANKGLKFSRKPFTMATSIVQKTEQAMAVRDAVLSASLRKPLEQSEGLISAGFVIPYPPGVPLVVPGERFTEALLTEIGFLLHSGIAVTGVKQGCVSIIDSKEGGGEVS